MLVLILDWSIVGLIILWILCCRLGQIITSAVLSGLVHYQVVGLNIGLVDSWVDYSFDLGLWAFSLGSLLSRWFR